MTHFFWQELWERMTGQVCLCEHARFWHRKSFLPRSDVQCGHMIFEGGAFGENGAFHCCQCLSFHKKPLPREIYPSYWLYEIGKVFERKLTPEEQLKQSEKNLKRMEEESKTKFFCICGHSAYDHGIGNPNRSSLFPLYPPCTKCSCKEYDYEKNPKISDSSVNLPKRDDPELSK